MTERRENASTHNNFPNKRGIVSRLERVNNDTRLSKFYKAVSDKWGDQSLAGEEILSDWINLTNELLEGDWKEYVHLNYRLYFQTLFWHQNPVFSNWISSIYTSQEFPATPVKKATSTPAKEAPASVKKVSIPDVDFKKEAEAKNVESTLSEEEPQAEEEPSAYDIAFEVYVESGASALTAEQLGLLQADGTLPESITLEVKEEKKPTPDFDSMKFMQLRKYAEDNNIDISGLRKKEEVLEAILESQTKS